MLKLKDKTINFFKYNKQFISYVILSLMSCTLIKVTTVGTIYWQSFFADFALILGLGSFCFFLTPQKQFRYLFILLIVFTAMSFINSIYYTFYHSFASFSLLTTLKQVGEVQDAVIAKIDIEHLMFLIFPVIFIFIHRHLLKKDYFNFVAKFEKGKKIFRYILGFVLLFGTIISLTISSKAYSRLAKQWNREYIVSKFGIITYQLNDLVNTLRPTITSWFGYDVALRDFNEFMEVYQNEKSDNKYTDIYKDKNVVFIHMESISTFLVDLKINDEEITPNLNKLTREGMYFNNFYPQVGVGTSSDTEFTLNTSLMPVLNGTAFVSYFDKTYITLPKLLKEKGYYTFSMHANKASMWNRNKMHPSLGYDRFYAEPSFEIDETIGLGLSDKSFFRQSISILEEIEKTNTNYMGTIITLSNHTPFSNNDLFEQIDLSYHGEYEMYDEHGNLQDPPTYLENSKMGNFLRSAHYGDAAMGLFIDYVNKSDYFNDTIFVFYGDHDPKLSNKEYSRLYNFNLETGERYTEEDEEYVDYDYYAAELNRKTPLIIWGKNTKPKKQIEYYMGMIDVMPTIGNMFGVYNKYAIGHDIFEIKEDNIIAFPNGNFLTNKVYYNNSKEEYKVLSLKETLSEEYIQECKDYTDLIIEISNGAVVHNLFEPSLKETPK